MGRYNANVNQHTIVNLSEQKTEDRMSEYLWTTSKDLRMRFGMHVPRFVFYCTSIPLESK